MKYCYDKKESSIVTIADRGKTYSSYRGTIDRHGNIKKFRDRYAPENGETCVRIWFGYDEYIDSNVYILETLDGKHQFTIKNDGVKLRSKKVMLT